MIALLSCFMNLSISSFATNLSTGGVKQDSLTNDSVLIAYSDLMLAEVKKTEESVNNILSVANQIRRTPNIPSNK